MTNTPEGARSVLKKSNEPRNVRTGLDVEDIKRDILDNLFYIQGKFTEVATPNDWYLAVAYAVKDRLMDLWVSSAHDYYEQESRTVCYFSAEFLIGPQLEMNLLRLGMRDEFAKAIGELGLDLDALACQEEEPGLAAAASAGWLRALWNPYPR